MQKYLVPSKLHQLDPHIYLLLLPSIPRHPQSRNLFLLLILWPESTRLTFSSNLNALIIPGLLINIGGHILSKYCEVLLFSVKNKWLVFEVALRGGELAKVVGKGMHEEDRVVEGTVKIILLKHCATGGA